MKITTVKYTARYDEFGSVKDVWVSAEGAMDDAEVAENQLDKIKEIVDKWYQSRHPQPGSQSAPMNYGPVAGPRIIETKPEDRVVGVTVESIVSCQDLKTLHTYKFLVRGNEELKAAYQKREYDLFGMNESLDDNK